MARPPVFYDVELLPPPPPPVFYGVELPGTRIGLDWNELCDESEDMLETLENDCPPGVVTFFVDAPLAAKDISLPKARCLSVLLEPEEETIIGTLLEPDARTIACNRLKIELEELRPEFKNAIAEMKDR